MTWSSSPNADRGSPSTRPVSAKTEVPTNDEAATVATTAPADGRAVLADPAGDVADDDQREGPAAGDVVGRRGEVEGEPGDEAEHRRELRAAGQRGADDDEQAEVGHDAVPREVREDGDLEDQGDATTAAAAASSAQGGHPQAPVGLDDGAVAGGAGLGTTTPTRSSAPKSTNGSMTARWAVSRRLL